MVKLKYKGTNQILAEDGVELQFNESVARLLAEDCWDLEIVYPEEHMITWMQSLCAVGVN